MSKSVYLSAGEASGDLHGAYLAEALRDLKPDIQLWGTGGWRMRRAGVDIFHDMTGSGTIGISETVKAAPRIVGGYFKARNALLSNRPDLFVPIDFGAFNVRLAQIAHNNGIAVVYYFPPSSWRRKPRNAEILKKCGGKVITPFSWSGEYLGESGLLAAYVGHPLVDIVKPALTREEFIKESGLSGTKPVVGLLPGSRSHELNEHLAPMIGAAKIINDTLGGAEFVIPAVSQAERIRKRIAAEPGNVPLISVVKGRAYDCMAYSDFLICTSGTATLEAAILGTPMIIIYRGSAIMRFEFIFRKTVLEEFIGLPNIIADKGVCPELINQDVTAEKLAELSLSILTSPDRVAAMKESLNAVAGMLGEKGAVSRAAQTLIELGDLNK